ncbi:hypothetical protein [Streptomyces sp. NBC_01244]|uniref:hypothetical protein n=1 Tax=Streptomyces sp. NBC_01244 TaxID=2903797 RepID=UPI002E0F611F|nr:hypothetical protein OG247_04345 [Streptomyces sp. NBC_01244]
MTQPISSFDPADIDRVRRDIDYYSPEVVVIEGRTGSRSDDRDWAVAIADTWNAPGVLALASDDVQLGETGYVRYAEDLPLGLDNTSSPAETPQRCVNTVVQRVRDGATVRSGELLEPGTGHRLGIGIGPRRADSLLEGDASYPDEVLDRRGRRLDILVEAADRPGRNRQHGRLYLPERGPAFTCPAADELPDDTRWGSLDHRACADSHHDLAQFTIPGQSTPGLITLEVLIYVGAAAVHKQIVELSVLEGPGAGVGTTDTVAPARGTGSRPAPIIQIARTVQRPFAVPWQVLYELPMENPDKRLQYCPSVDEYGPGGDGSWPPPALCPHQGQHDQAMGSPDRPALLCPFGFQKPGNCSTPSHRTRRISSTCSAIANGPDPPSVRRL